MTRTLFIVASIFALTLLLNCTQHPHCTLNTTTVIDAAGNVYHTVKIGKQTWTIENLKTTKYNDGTPIPLVIDSADWSLRTTPGYCWYCNDTNIAKESYGALYNWYAVNTGKLAPIGWHVPTDAEWSRLTTYIGGECVAGGKLKETGLSRWLSPNTGATNQTGFSARPGGGRGCDGGFYGMGRRGHWWTASGDYYSFRRSLYSDDSSVERTTNDNHCGYYVRLVKDCKGDKEAALKEQAIEQEKALPNIMVDFKEVAFKDLSQKQQDNVKKIAKSFGKYISISMTAKSLLGKVINIDYNKKNKNKFDFLYKKIDFIRDKNAKENDTLLINKAIVITKKYCQSVFNAAGYPQNSLYSLQPDINSISGWYSTLIALANNDTTDNWHQDLGFKEYYNGIEINNSSAMITYMCSKIHWVMMRSYALSEMKISALKPTLSIYKAIEIYRNKRNLPQSIAITPFSSFRDRFNTDNSHIDSFPTKDLVYMPNKDDTTLTLCWMLWIMTGNCSDIHHIWVDAVTGAIVMESNGGCMY